MEDNKEKIRRFNVTLGIFVAAILGFLLNLLANLYYAMFITHTLKWNEANHMQVYGIILLFLALVGFLKFFIDDHENTLEMNTNFFKRYINYFFYKFTPGKFIRVALGIYISLALISILIGLYFFIASIAGYIITNVIVVVILISFLYQRKTNRSNKLTKIDA
jgi:hypothetical protein